MEKATEAEPMETWDVGMAQAQVWQPKVVEKYG